MSNIVYRNQAEVKRHWQDADLRPANACKNILIGGAPRTGTTMLQGILCTDPRCNPLIGEVAPLRFLVDAFDKSRRHTKANIGKIYDSADDIQSLYHGYVDQFLADLKQRYSAEYLVVKEPEFTKNIPALVDVYPDWLFVIIIRDPRATIASMLKWGERMQTLGSHLFKTRNMDELCKFYNGFYIPLIRREYEALWSNLMFVRYEDIVDKNKNTVSRLAGFTGLDLRNYEKGGSWGRTRIDFDKERQSGNVSITGLYGKPITKRAQMGYKKVLGWWELKAIAKHCARFMRYFDYLR